MALFDRAVATVLPAVPRSFVQRVSAPYIAGPTLDDARRTVVGLNAAGKRATVDVLGEEVHNEEEARAIAAAYAEVLAAIDADALDANISVKLTGLGLKLDIDLCRSLLETLVRDAGARGSFVRIDMEDASCVDDTLALYRDLRGAGIDNVGIVLQAYLRRTLTDIDELRDLAPSVRLCKGIYIEPGSIAFQDAEVIRRSFVSCLETLLDGGSRVAIATHDEALIGEALSRVGVARRRRVRVPDAARSAREPRRRARGRRPSAARLRALRPTLVRVLAAAPAGESTDGRRDRQGDPREGYRPQLMTP